MDNDYIQRHLKRNDPNYGLSNEERAEKLYPNISTDTQIRLARSEVDDHQNRIISLEAGLREIYQERGEDPLIARICNELLQ